MRIIILHGLYMHGLVMLPLSHQLQKLGYDTKIISYNTVSINEEAVFENIDKQLKEGAANVLIGHSLGGLLIKRYLADRKPSQERVSHVITMGSPLRGASIVSRLQFLGLDAFLGNSPQHGLKEHCDQWNFTQKLGCIAGTNAFGARSLFMRNDRTPSDGTVTVDETKLDGMQDHLEVPHTHTSLIYSNQVPKQIDHFIKTNHFK
ncbi:esterase/lipase family protein [Vibrio sagamiensis]|uniref:Cobinamide adenolsyltransferase n=1 Tax=Vibrio sagamiensis NBRC 104589 TaxID=1219064 RepID=A0A511QG65_9VIBR|nr:alpha/beta fold hydrolase [Vibrio sagamiensis]PNQ54436.1 cobinamide adenolsyltransferase [Vibrio agarivorans]GEM76187.1 hypothetical protein VSA01S_22990 [Vibrio sagamiensis NBRC 104589]